MSDRNFTFGQSPKSDQTQNNQPTNLFQSQNVGAQTQESNQTGSLFGQGTTVPFKNPFGDGDNSQQSQANQGQSNMFNTGNMQQSNAQQSNLQQSNLQQPTLQQSNLQHPSLQQPNFQQSNLQHSNLQQPSLQQSNLNASTEVKEESVQISAGDIPLSFPQSTVGQIFDQIEKRLNNDLQVFKNKAEQIAICDKQIIRIRNNYINLIERIKREEENLKEIEESLVFIEDYVNKTIKEEDQTGNKKINNNNLLTLSRIEQSFDDLMGSIQNKNDIENSLTGIVNENMRLLKCINKELDEM